MNPPPEHRGHTVRTYTLVDDAGDAARGLRAWDLCTQRSAERLPLPLQGESGRRRITMTYAVEYWKSAPAAARFRHSGRVASTREISVHEQFAEIAILSSPQSNFHEPHSRRDREDAEPYRWAMEWGPRPFRPLRCSTCRAPPGTRAVSKGHSDPCGCSGHDKSAIS